MTAATPNARKAAERARKRAAGLVPLEVWVRRDDVPTVRAMLSALSPEHRQKVNDQHAAQARENEG